MSIEKNRQGGAVENSDGLVDVQERLRQLKEGQAKQAAELEGRHRHELIKVFSDEIQPILDKANLKGADEISQLTMRDFLEIRDRSMNMTTFGSYQLQQYYGHLLAKVRGVMLREEGIDTSVQKTQEGMVQEEGKWDAAEEKQKSFLDVLSQLSEIANLQYERGSIGNSLIPESFMKEFEEARQQAEQSRE